MPIFVETTIRAPIETVWHFTQDPALHQRWDLRFTEISYLPKATEDSPQRFVYRTRIGLGLDIAGEGESIGERSSDDGSRTSLLRFWSSDPKSLIREGSGYWKYVPITAETRFFTLYDYQTRFGLLGRVFDMVVFRPLMAWATAWSFDRLRLWIEDGVRPEDAQRTAIVHALSRFALAFIWIYQGLIPKLLVRDSGEVSIAAAGVGNLWAPTVVTFLALFEVALGAALILLWRSRAILVFSAIVVTMVTVAGVAFTPSIATAPFNAVTLSASMVALAIIAFLTSDGPSASRTRWSSRRRP